MSRRRFIADSVQDGRAFLTGEHAHHLSRVLRVRTGQHYEITHGGYVWDGTVESISDERLEFVLGEKITGLNSPVIQTTLLLSIFKFDRLEWAIEKVVELGVTTIVPVIAKRTEINFAKAAQKRLDRWRRIAREASQQSRRVSEPHIHEPIELKGAIADVADDAVRIVLAERGQRNSLLELLQVSSAGPFTIAIGPEGGWTDDEIAVFAQCSWAFASLGANILRAETAAIATLSVVCSLNHV